VIKSNLFIFWFHLYRCWKNLRVWSSLFINTKSRFNF